MKALELIAACQRERHWQLRINQFIDDFRAAAPEQRQQWIAVGPSQNGRFEGLVAAVISALARETGTRAPAWLQSVGCDEPFFAFPAKGYALRVRLMLESPPAFRCRNVFVPANYLDRA